MRFLIPIYDGVGSILLKFKALMDHRPNILTKKQLYIYICVYILLGFQELELGIGAGGG